MKHRRMLRLQAPRIPTADFPIVVHASFLRSGCGHRRYLIAEKIEVGPKRGAEETVAAQLERLVFENVNARSGGGFPELFVQAPDALVVVLVVAGYIEHGH